MAKKPQKPPKITDLPAQPKHHEMQAIKNVAYIRQSVKFLMASSLKNIRSKLSMVEGNEEHVERLRGESGDEILARCTSFVLLEIGDTSTSIETGAMRAVTRGVKGEMGLGSEDFDDEESDEESDEEPETKTA